MARSFFLHYRLLRIPPTFLTQNVQLQGFTPKSAQKDLNNTAIDRQEYIFWTEYDYKYISTATPDKWLEPENQFVTNDIIRAQEHVLFPIVLPTYLPNSKQKFPIIHGSLNPSNDMKSEIRITYGVLPNEIIMITEGKYRTYSSQLIVEGRETVEIAGKPVSKNKSNTIFSYNSEEVCFSIVAFDVPGEEVLKVVESMLKQIK